MNETKVRISILVITVLLCISWGAAVWVYESQQYRQQSEALIDSETVHARTRGETITADIQRSLRVMYGIPEVLSTWTELVQVIQTDHPAKHAAQPLKRLNQLLSLTKTDFSADVVWVLNASGDCIAASNYDLPATFIGKNFKERAYFQTAIQGGNGYQFAVGKVSHEPGLYFSAPVQVNANVIGAVVVKVDIARLAHHIDFSNVFMVDENGVAVLAEDQNFAMKAVTGNLIENMSFEQRRSTYMREQFESLEIVPWPGYPRLSRVGNSPLPYIVHITNVDRGDLKIYVLEPAQDILQLEQQFWRLVVLITVCGAALIVIVAGVAWYSHENYVTSQLLQLQHDELNQAQRLARVGSWSYNYLSNKVHCSQAMINHFFMLDEEPQTISSPVHYLLAETHPDDKEQLEAVFREGLEQGKSFGVEYRMLLKNGEIRNVVANAQIEKNSRGQRLKMTGTCRDVTEEQHAMHVIEASENHLRKVLNSSLIGIIQGNDTGRIVDMNEAFMSLTGYAREEIFEGRLKWKTIATPQCQDLNGPAIFGLSSTPAPFEMDLVTADGTLIHVLTGMAKVEDARSEWVCFVLDLTERNRVNRIQSEFISVVSHELRTPLTSIRGSLALLESGMLDADAEKKLDLIRIAHRNSQRLIKIVNDILDMEKLAAGKMEFASQTVDLAQLIAQAVEFNSGFAGQFHVRFVQHVLPENALVYCDPERLMQVLTNLMSNAAKFSPEHGNVDLHLTREQAQWRIAVTDHGPGIPVQFRSRIFGAFTQAEDANTRQKGGTGLGLNIAKVMVEKMGGTIGFDSEPGQGATFWVLLDAMPEQ